MKPVKKKLSLERLHEVLSYDANTGVFVWLIGNQWGMPMKKGQIAGRLDTSTGYMKIKIDSEFIYAHRLAWFYHYGSWPELSVDHADQIKTDNAISNLRLATPAQQQANMGLKRNNKSGVIGVVLRKPSNKWEAQIEINGKSTYLGRFSSLEEASAVRQAAAKAAFGEFAA